MPIEESHNPCCSRKCPAAARVVNRAAYFFVPSEVANVVISPRLKKAAARTSGAVRPGLSEKFDVKVEPAPEERMIICEFFTNPRELRRERRRMEDLSLCAYRLPIPVYFAFMGPLQSICTALR